MLRNRNKIRSEVILLHFAFLESLINLFTGVKLNAYKMKIHAIKSKYLTCTPADDKFNVVYGECCQKLLDEILSILMLSCGVENATEIMKNYDAIIKEVRAYERSEYQENQTVFINQLTQKVKGIKDKATATIKTIRAQNLAYADANYYPLGLFVKLPIDLLPLIAQYCSINDLLNMRQAAKFFNEHITRNKFWEIKAKKQVAQNQKDGHSIFNSLLQSKKSQPTIPPVDAIFKIKVIGESGVGKTCLVLRCTEDTYTESCRINTDFKARTLNVEGSSIKLQLFHTQYERINGFDERYFKGAHAYFIVYDVTDQFSFTKAEECIKSFKGFANKGCIAILVGNKCDLVKKKVVDYNTAKELADVNGMVFLETSAKDGINTESLLLTVISELDKSFTIKMIQLNKAIQAMHVQLSSYDELPSAHIPAKKCSIM